MNFLKKALGSIQRKVSDVVDSFDEEEDEDEIHEADMLHGHLFIDIFSAKDLPDMESWVAKLVDPKDVTDAYVDVELGKAKIAKTSVILNDLNPVWNETFRLDILYMHIYILRLYNFNSMCPTDLRFSIL